MGFFSLFAIFGIGAFGALMLRKFDTAANWWGNIFAILGSLLGIAFGIAALTSISTFSFAITTASFPIHFPFQILSFSVDKLSALFIIIISAISLLSSIYAIGYVKHFYRRYNIGTLGFFYNLFIAGMLLVVSSANALLFLLAWEAMSLTTYFLVAYERAEKKSVDAGLLYFSMMQAGTACIALLFMVFYHFAGSFEFSAMQTAAQHIPILWQTVIFILAIIGFGMKAGIVPLHIWLPAAHPAAPSHVSALMSGVMIKTGIYMLIRILIGFFPAQPIWWGLTITGIGAISAVLGVLYALTEHDLKRLLAYHSIENIGIILLGLGSALTFSALHLPALAALALTASLFHTINHATFKSLLFLGAGSVITQTHTGNIEEYGGLWKKMPQTALFFLIGSMAISALPPFNGFFSEWLTYQSLFAGIGTASFATILVSMVSAGALALTGGLALACFVKAFGITFLARPRSEHAEHAHESALSMRLGMALIAGATLVLGISSGYIVGILQTISKPFFAFAETVPTTLLTASPQTISIQDGLSSSVSGSTLAVALIGMIFLTALFTLYGIYRKQHVTIGRTWDCGSTATPRMEITATGFSRTIVTIFKTVLRPRMQTSAGTVTLSVADLSRVYIYQPTSSLSIVIATQVKKIQNGTINTYLMYTAVALLLGLLFSNLL